MNIKKILALLLAFVMALSLCACGSNNTPSGSTPPTNENEQPETEPVELIVFAAASMTALIGSAPH